MSNFHVFGEGKVGVRGATHIQTGATVVFLSDHEEAQPMDVKIPADDSPVPLGSTALVFPDRESMARFIGILQAHMEEAWKA